MEVDTHEVFYDKPTYIYICGDSKVRQEGNGTRNHVRQVDVCAYESFKTHATPSSTLRAHLYTTF